MEMEMDALDLVALLVGPGLALIIGIGGADGVGTGGSGGLLHFFQISKPMQKMANVIQIMAAGDINVQWVSAGLTWSNSLKSLLASNSLLYLVLSPRIPRCIDLVLAHPNSSISSLAQSMVFV
jgi:hypothetical protein